MKPGTDRPTLLQGANSFATPAGVGVYGNSPTPCQGFYEATPPLFPNGPGFGGTPTSAGSWGPPLSSFASIPPSLGFGGTPAGAGPWGPPLSSFAGAPPLLGFGSTPTGAGSWGSSPSSFAGSTPPPAYCNGFGSNPAGARPWGSSLSFFPGASFPANSSGFDNLMVGAFDGVQFVLPPLASSASLPSRGYSYISYADGLVSPSPFSPDGQPLLSAQRSVLQLVEAASNGSVAKEEAGAWHSILVDRLREWQSEEASQHQFWLLYNALEAKGSYELVLSSFADFFSEAPAFNLAETRRDLTPWNSYSDLSARSIRFIIGDVVSELEKLNASCVITVLAHLSRRIESQIFVRGVFRRLSMQAATAFDAASTHTWVLDFVIHTGSSPPALADRRPAVRRARVSFAATRMVDHGTVLRQKNSTNLRNAICRRNTRACCNRRSQGYAFAGRCLRLAGRWGHRRPHNSLVKCA